jgi:hypothetical protein
LSTVWFGRLLDQMLTSSADFPRFRHGCYNPYREGHGGDRIGSFVASYRVESLITRGGIGE